MTATFRAATRIRTGIGAIQSVRAEALSLGATRVAVVADSGLIALGLAENIVRQAGVADLVVATIASVVDPSPASVQAGAQTAIGAGADAVLGIGGGSGLGAAKAIALLLADDVPVLSLEGTDKALRPPVPMIAIPTTAGSGSEVSNALVLHESGLVREIVIRGDGYEPRVAILDASVLRGLPRLPLLYAGLDALSHAMEALWAAGASMFTNACALRAAATIIDRLPDAVAGTMDGSNRAGKNDGLLQELLEASCLANLACGNSGLALVHALSSAPSVKLPHGLQNGVLLPAVARLNRSALSPEAAALAARLPTLYARLDFTARFDPGTADVDAMIAASTGHAFRRNNRIPHTDDDLRVALADAGALHASPSEHGPAQTTPDQERNRP